jgi:hypothetical protein
MACIGRGPGRKQTLGQGQPVKAAAYEGAMKSPANRAFVSINKPPYVIELG